LGFPSRILLPEFAAHRLAALGESDRTATGKPRRTAARVPIIVSDTAISVVNAARGSVMTVFPAVFPMPILFA
jgi:hypothetical protein